MYTLTPPSPHVDKHGFFGTPLPCSVHMVYERPLMPVANTAYLMHTALHCIQNMYKSLGVEIKNTPIKFSKVEKNWKIALQKKNRERKLLLISIFSDFLAVFKRFLCSCCHFTKIKVSKPSAICIFFLHRSTAWGNFIFFENKVIWKFLNTGIEYKIKASHCNECFKIFAVIVQT